MMNRNEMIELLNHEMEGKNSRLEQLNREGEIRRKDVLEIQARFERGEIRTREEAEALVAEVEHHLERMRELRREVVVMTMDIMFDLKAIYEAED